MWRKKGTTEHTENIFIICVPVYVGGSVKACASMSASVEEDLEFNFLMINHMGLNELGKLNKSTE